MAFNFDKLAKKLKIEIPQTIKTDIEWFKIRNILFSFMEKYNYPDYMAKQTAEDINFLCKNSTVVVDGKIINTLLYHHPGLRGRNFVIPGGFSEINYGRKNDRCAVERGDIHFKSIPKPVMQLIKVLEKNMFSCIR